MSEFNYLKEKARMVETRENGDCSIDCESCLLSKENNGKGCSCGRYEKLYPDEATAAVKKWAEEHPRMTNWDKFREVFRGADFRGKEKYCGGNCLSFVSIPCNNCGWWDEEYVPQESEE